ncbi:SH3 domain-containing protein [Endogone sp. FLAS-F59071]|nr:SH3 domain-containing protein [Endogone sp. FLAS-F59071]|eukprot:RUS17551.1 SH3 domain-containing protein [Endogone sp. FLAS-F59071]
MIDNNVVSQSVYHDIVALLPQELDELGQANGAAQDRSVRRPPLPARKSTTVSTSTSASSSSSSLSTVAKRLSELSNNGTQEIPMPVPRRSVPSSPQPPTTYTQPVTTYDRPPSATYDRPTSTYSQPKTTLRSSVHDKQQQAIQEEHGKDEGEAAPSYAITTAEALYDFLGDDPETDLSFRKGDIIEVTEFVNDEWWSGTLNGHKGIFPQNYVKIVPSGVARRAPPPLPATYAPPPSQQNPPEDDGKSRYARNLGNNVAQAATFGFGAQVGAKLANSIF